MFRVITTQGSLDMTTSRWDRYKQWAIEKSRSTTARRIASVAFGGSVASGFYTLVDITISIFPAGAWIKGAKIANGIFTGIAFAITTTLTLRRISLSEDSLPAIQKKMTALENRIIVIEKEATNSKDILGLLSTQGRALDRIAILLKDDEVDRLLQRPNEEEKEVLIIKTDTFNNWNAATSPHHFSPSEKDAKDPEAEKLLNDESVYEPIAEPSNMTLH